MVTKFIDRSTEWLRKLFRLSSRDATIQQSRGKRGEDLATRYLKQNTPYKILLRNWSNGRQEIDVICRDADSLVFVEVRARNVSALVSGYASVNAGKKKSLRKAAYSYMKTLPERPHTYRYDIVELGMQGSDAEHIRHYKNVKIF